MKCDRVNQIQAADACGARSWLPWNPFNGYSVEAFEAKKRQARPGSPPVAVAPRAEVAFAVHRLTAQRAERAALLDDGVPVLSDLEHLRP